MRTIIVIAAVLVVLTNAGSVSAQFDCDSLYYLLQNLMVGHLRANEILVDQFIDCPAGDTLGGFILSGYGTEGEKDRAVIARRGGREGWLYAFGERGRNIRFKKPTPRLDIDGDGGLDLVFTVTDITRSGGRGYQIVFVDDNKQRSVKGLRFPDGMVIDSLLPAPDGRPRPLLVADRRAWDIGGLDDEKIPVSYRYMAWDDNVDPPDYVNRTTAHKSLFPIMQQRAEYVKALPKSEELKYTTAEEYEDFLSNVIGYCMDQSNLGREEEGFKEIEEILNRVRYEGSTDKLDAPRQVRDALRRILPEAKLAATEGK